MGAARASLSRAAVLHPAPSKPPPSRPGDKRPRTDAGAAHLRPSQVPAAELGRPGPGKADPLRGAEDVVRGEGTPLEAGTRASMERRLGQDFDGVEVHKDPAAGRSADALGARAFTVGRHIVFGSGRYAPGTSAGDELIAHELTHVGQQAPGVERTGPLHLGPFGGPFESAAEAASLGGPSGLLTKQPVGAGTIQRAAVAVQRFSPAPGVWIDRTDKSIAITGAMELWGDEATADRAKSIQDTINAAWTHSFPDGYSVTCNVTITYRPKGSKATGGMTQIEVLKMFGGADAPSYTDTSAHTITLNSQGTDVFTWTPAHEFGHLMGLKDRYSESIMSSIKGKFGGERTTTVQPGYEGNLMAEHKGATESKNVKDLAEETEPSWLHDDDQVRAWVNAHSLDDISKLSTANKLSSIATLMSGWVSDDDLAAMIKILRSVKTAAEARQIRAAVHPNELNGFGQRARLQMALDAMPT